MSELDCLRSYTCLRLNGHEGDCHPGEYTPRPSPKDVVLCSETGCNRAASYGPWCVEHRAGHRSEHVVDSLRSTHEFTEAQYAAIRRQLAIDAAPYIVAAFQFIAAPGLMELVAEADTLPPATTPGLYL